jgi:hypothetical protein
VNGLPPASLQTASPVDSLFHPVWIRLSFSVNLLGYQALKPAKQRAMTIGIVEQQR